MAHLETCRVCGSVESKFFLHSFDQKTKNPNHELLLVKCTKCDFVFLSPRPADEIAVQYFNEVYSQVNPGSYYDPKRARKKCSNRLAWLNSQCIDTEKRLLDVGAGIGAFVEIAIDGGWDARGIEPDPHAVKTSQERLGNAVTCGTLDDLPLDEVFDVVTMWDVIEHVHEPSVQMRAAVKHLRDGGYVIASTANVDSDKFLSRHEKWDMLFSGHLSYFSPQTLGKMMEDSGLSDIKFFNASKVDSPNKAKPNLMRRIRTVAARSYRCIRYAGVRSSFSRPDIPIMVAIGRKN